jgi:hypothetical protein
MPSTRHRSPTISLSVAAYSFKFAVISFFDTWGRHHEEVVRRYTKFLRRARKAGEISTYQESELDTLAYLLIAARDYIYLYHLHRSKQNTGNR